MTTTNITYNSPFLPEQQNNSNVNTWKDYRNTNVVTSEIFTHGHTPSLNHHNGLNNNQNFDTLYEHQTPNFQSGKYLYNSTTCF